MLDESAIFNDLQQLVARRGYVYVLAALCLKHKFSPESKLSQVERLIVTERGLLIGLFAKTKRDLTIPRTEDFEDMFKRTELLLSKLHEALSRKFQRSLFAQPSSTNKQDSLGEAEFVREAMIYSGESGYTFQYRDMCCKKYIRDNQWLIDNQGFSINDACAVYDGIEQGQLRKLKRLSAQTSVTAKSHNRLLDAFLISKDYIAEYSGLSRLTVDAVTNAFTMNHHNEGFRSMSDFNAADATPLIPINDNRFALFELHILAQSLYESPFYWMMRDKEYLDIHTDNRGKYCEEFCADRLRRVFGDDNVYTNVLVPLNQKETAAEIDVLAHFADKLVIIESKSKRLTIDARKGNLNAIKRDFSKGIQHACNQGYVNARLLLDEEVRKRIEGLCSLRFPHQPKEVLVLGVLADHYPGLSVQVQKYLQYSRHSNICAPLITDTFALDVITEILDNPLYFFSYLKRRSQYMKQVVSAQELTIFGFHLSQNLWVQTDYDLVALDGDFCRDLDSVMIRRRCFGEESVVPEGILTRFEGTLVGTILQSLRKNDDPSMFEVGQRLLEMSEKSLHNFQIRCQRIIELARIDGKVHDFSLWQTGGQFGITVHCNVLPYLYARQALLKHCQLRKYRQQSSSWYGLCLSPYGRVPRFGVRVQYPWQWSRDMEKEVRQLKEPVADMKSGGRTTKKKIGRNETCPCGSGRKYKKCCLAHGFF